jgi:hypothetical protein
MLITNSFIRDFIYSFVPSLTFRPSEHVFIHTKRICPRSFQQLPENKPAVISQGSRRRDTSRPGYCTAPPPKKTVPRIREISSSHGGGYKDDRLLVYRAVGCCAV